MIGFFEELDESEDEAITPSQSAATNNITVEESEPIDEVNLSAVDHC
jgi:hypothetical protein